MRSRSPISTCVVEDEVDLLDEIVAALTREGFAVRGYSGSRELYLGLLQEPCDVVILDIGLPGEDGLTILDHLRATTDIGIVMLTARGLISDRVIALRGGADAYLVKPVDMDELAATLVSVVRRVRRRPEDDSGVRPGDRSDWHLSADQWFLVGPHGAHIPLSASERALLNTLLVTPGAVVSRESLVQAMGYHPDEVI